MTTTSPRADEAPDVVRLSVRADERAAGRLDAERAEIALHAIMDDGFVVLDDLLDVDEIDRLNTRMLDDVPELIRRAEEAPRPWRGHLQHQPPFDPEFFFPELIAPTVVANLLRRILGERAQLVLWTANTNVPGSLRQHIHADNNQLWPDLDVPTPPFQLASSTPLVDTTSATATELWPGSHLDPRTHRAATSSPFAIPEAWLAERRATRPPVQLAQTRGSTIVRDLRVWHGGVPNTSDGVRVMLNMVYAPSWFAASPILFPRAAQPLIETLAIPAIAEYTDEPFDALSWDHSGLHGPQFRRHGDIDYSALAGASTTT